MAADERTMSGGVGEWVITNYGKTRAKSRFRDSFVGPDDAILLQISVDKVSYQCAASLASILYSGVCTHIQVFQDSRESQFSTTKIYSAEDLREKLEDAQVCHFAIEKLLWCPRSNYPSSSTTRRLEIL